MADKIPIRGGFNGGSLTGLAQFASGDTLGVAHGGTGVVTIGSNALVTGNGTSAMTSESNLTFDGTILKSTGDLCATVKVVAPALCIGSEYVLPTADGSAGQLMCTDGSGALAFATAPSSGISFNGSTANGVATYSSSTVADVESMLTFASPVLTIGASSTAELRLQGHGTNDVKGISIYAGGDFPVLEQYTLGLNWSGGTIEYDALNTFDHAFQIAGTTKLIITSGGKVGIGTTVPDSTLHVFTASAGAASPATNADDLVVENSAAGGISILTPDANDGILKFGSPTLDYNGSISVNHNSASPYMDFNVNSAARMRIDSSGNVGIGTSAPDSILHVMDGSAGSVSPVGHADNFTFEVGGQGGFTLLTPDANGAYFVFGSPSDNDYAYLYGFYNAGSPKMVFGVGADAMTIDCKGHVGFGLQSTGEQLKVTDIENTTNVAFHSKHASFAGLVQQYNATRSASSAYSFAKYFSNIEGSADVEFNLRGDGQAYADASWNNSGADYQEWFESADGSELEVGKAVVLDGDKVRIYNADTDSTNDIFGVTRPQADNKNSAVIGNTAWNHWTDKYLTDDWGVYLREDVTVWAYTEDGKETAVYERDQAADWTPPEGAVSSLESVRKLNPEYSVEVDDETNYSPRADRNEWNLIGLLGQVQIKADEPTRPTWIKMKDISDAVELWMVR